jgi:hypothetical protein
MSDEVKKYKGKGTPLAVTQQERTWTSGQGKVFQTWQVAIQPSEDGKDTIIGEYSEPADVKKEGLYMQVGKEVEFSAESGKYGWKISKPRDGSGRTNWGGGNNVEAAKISVCGPLMQAAVVVALKRDLDPIAMFAEMYAAAAVTWAGTTPKTAPANDQNPPANDQNPPADAPPAGDESDDDLPF